MPTALAPSVQERLSAVRQRVLDRSRWLVTIGLPVSLSFMARDVARGGVSASAIINALAISLCVGAAWLLRRRSTRLQGVVFTATLTTLAVTALVHNGPLIGVGVIGLVAGVGAVIYLGTREAVAVLALFALAMAAVGVAATTHRIEYSGIGPWNLAEGANWVRMTITVALGSLAAFALTAALLNGFELAIHDLQASLDREKAAQAERETALLTLAAAQKIEALGRIASGIAHDMNNTLAVMLCSADLIADDPRSPQVGELAEEIRRAAIGGASMAGQLLAFSRGEVGRKSAVEPQAFLARMAKILRRVLPDDVVLVSAGSTSRRLFADEGQLERVLLNLGINARDAMPSGGRLTLSTRDGDPNSVVIEVTDTGAGMDEPTRARAFDPFFTTKDRGKGTGLGLASVQGIVRAHGGRTEIDSAPGRGTTVRIVLPVATAQDVSPSESMPPVAASSARILLAEDLPELRSSMRIALASEGHDVVEASTVDQALELIVPGSGFDLVCTDAVMPGSHTTLELLDAVRDRLGIPVLVCSGHVEEELVRRGIESGRYAFLKKPFSASELKDAIARTVRTGRRGAA